MKLIFKWYFRYQMASSSRFYLDFSYFLQKYALYKLAKC